MSGVNCVVQSDLSMRSQLAEQHWYILEDRCEFLLHESKSVKHCTNVHVVPLLPVDELLDGVLYSTVLMLHSGPLQVLRDIHQYHCNMP